MSEMRIAVIGSGIGGLTFCVAFGKISNTKVDLYEAAAQFGEVGAGIGMWYRSWEIMKQLGLQDDLASLENQALKNEARVGFYFRKSDQPDGSSFYDMMTVGGMLSLHRADFQRAILKNLPNNCDTHFHKKLITYDDKEGGPIVLHFADGSTAECDVLIGSDGIKSAVRYTLYQSLATANIITQEESTSPNPIWSGSVAYRGLIPREVLEKQAPIHRTLNSQVMYCGKNKHLVVFPISKGQKVNVVAFCSDPTKEGTIFSENPEDWVANVTQGELLEQYSGWEDEVISLLKCIDKPSRWAIHALKPLSTYASGRVALIGDAAHAMTPHLGSGAGQAIEDAYVLAALLASPKCARETLSQVLGVYNQVRQPKGNKVQDLSRSNGLIFELNGPGFEDIKANDSAVANERLQDLGKQVSENWEWAWSTSAEDDVQKALAMLS